MFFFYFIFITCIKGIKKPNEFQSSSLIISSNDLPNYSPLDSLSFNELCYSLQATKFFFGINSLNSYSQCILSQQLIGLNTSELKTEQPVFYLNLASVFCKYELKYSSNGFSEELSKLILGNIKA